MEINYGVWLSWLKARGRLQPSADPGARASVERLGEYLAEMRWAGCSDHTCATRLTGLSAALRVMAPAYDSRRLSRAAGRIRSSARRSRNVRSRALPAADLLQLASDLMKSAERDACPLERSMLFRDGLLLALLVHRPLRIANFAVIEIDRHLIRSPSGYLLEFEAAEMKAHRPYRCTVPRVLTKSLDRYISEFRSTLAAQASEAPAVPALWLGNSGQALKPESVAAIVRRRTKAALGVGMGPHQLRHTIATAVAEHAPERVGDVAAILGHANQTTSERHYIHAKAGQAVRSLDDALNSLVRRAACS